MKKVLSIVLSLLMVISMYNIMLTALATTVYGISDAGIEPTVYNNSNISDVNDPAHPEFYQFKWASPTTVQSGSLVVTVTVPGSSPTQTVSATVHYETTDNQHVTWWITDQATDNAGYKLIMNWVAVKGGNNYHLYTYPASFTHTIGTAPNEYVGDFNLVSPQMFNPQGKVSYPDLSHVVFCLTYTTTTTSSSSSSTSTTSISDSSVPTSGGSSSSESSSSSTSSESSSSSTSSESSSSSTSSESSSSESQGSSSSETTISDSSVPLSGGSSSSETTISDPDIPKTSAPANQNIALYVMVLMASGTMLVMLNMKRGKANK